MSNTKLPDRASLEYLKKLAKDRLRELRQTDPHTKLATALLAVARDHGFSSWRALKAEVELRQSKSATVFFEACAKGDVEALRSLLTSEPDLVRLGNPDAQHSNWTGLHTAAQRGHLNAVHLLLKHGADPNAREAGDNTYPLHWAAANRHIEIVRALLDAGGDAHGTGDVHLLDAIGWATFYHAPGAVPGDQPETAALLLGSGAHHHIFSAISTGDPDLIRKLVEENPEALDRRMSRFEQKLTPLHFAMSLKRYEILDLLIELGADIEAEDAQRQTAMATAMMHSDREAMRRLQAAGAKQPQPMDVSNFTVRMAGMAESIKKGVPMLEVPDVAQTLDWYKSIGFKELARYADDGLVTWGMLQFGKSGIMLNMHGKSGRHDVSLWFYTDQVEGLYQLLKSRQLAAAQRALAGNPASDEGIEFVQHIYDPPYGGREFSIRDLNGYILNFLQPAEG